jgi:hypothetical protein
MGDVIGRSIEPQAKGDGNPINFPDYFHIVIPGIIGKNVCFLILVLMPR